MKCQYCGGEVEAQSTKCPYCGRENKDGIAFQEEVNKRAERNKKLPPIILKKNAGWMSQKMMTRVVIITGMVNVLLIFVIIGFVLLTQIPSGRKPVSGSIAEDYINTYKEEEEVFYKEFVRQAFELMDCKADEASFDEYDYQNLAEAAYRVMNDKIDKTKEYGEQEKLVVTAFFRGYLQFSEEEASFLIPDEDTHLTYYLDPTEATKVAALMKERMNQKYKEAEK